MAKFFGRFSGNVTKRLLKQAKQLVSREAVDISESQTEILKQRLLDAVENSDVCQELRNLTTPSKFVDSKSGTATLFGYLGFDAGSDPVSDLIDFLRENIEVKTRRKFFIGNKIVTTLVVPTKEQMSSDSNLVLKRLGISWPQALEDGLADFSNAEFFLQSDAFGKPMGFSDLGIQVKNAVRPALGRVQFLSVIFKDFRAKFGSVK